MVIENLCRGLDSIGAAYDYFHYRTSGGAEVDLVLEGEFGLLPIETQEKVGISTNQIKVIGFFQIKDPPFRRQSMKKCGFTGLPDSSNCQTWKKAQKFTD